ncbi:MAG TPA: hypothetical protein VGO58_01630 [Chitinophagaceae bacterium]|jgi:hypothetical protein|nr:hypothetical protein [Chitinophagaceae bacterium]
MWIVTIIYWLQLFLCPAIICGAAGSLIEKQVSIFALILGAVIGIVAAEYVRKKIGLDIFFAGIHGSKQILEKLDENKKKNESGL